MGRIAAERFIGNVPAAFDERIGGAKLVSCFLGETGWGPAFLGETGWGLAQLA